MQKRIIGSPYNGPRISLKYNINRIIRRQYETILKAPEAPSAINYQMTKLQALRGSTIRGGLFSKLTSLNAWSVRHPLLLAIGISTVKSGVCDWLAQTGIERRNWDTFNWSRFTLFALFGMLLLT